MSGIRGFLVTAILALAGGAWAGGGAIALIPGAGERSPDGALMATLETALLTDPSLTMVEREHIQKILAEQALAAGGFEAREQRLQLGKILGAAVLIFVDKVPGSTPSASVVRVTDSRTGIILDSWTIQDSEAKAQAAQWPETMKAALAKSRLPPAKRRAVGLLEFRSEESGTALESLADGMGELLMAELGRAPTVLVLDREHLDHLRAEKALSAMDQELKSSAWMIEAGLRRTGQNGELDVALSVRPLTGAQPVSQTVSVRRGDMLAASRALAAAVAKLVQTDPPAASGTSTNEASTYARQVSVWGRWGWNDTGKALRAAEAAYALAPSLDNVNALVAALGAHHLTLRNAVRMQSLLLDYYQRLPALVAEGATTNLVLPASEYYYGALGYRGPPKDHVESAEDAQQRAELLDLEEKVFRFQVAYYKQHYAQLGEEYWWAWARRLGGRSTIWVGPADGNLRAYAPGHPDRQVALIREAVETFLNPPARPDWYPASRLMVLMVVPTQLAPFFKYEDHGYRVVYEADVEKPFRELMEEYTRHKDPLVRFMAHYGLVNNYGELCQVAGSAPSKVELMRLMVEDIPPSHPARATVTNGVVGLFHGGYENDRILLRRCCATIGLLAPNAQWEHWPAWLVEKELDGYAALFRSAIDTRDAGRCFVFERETIFNRLDSLAFYGRTNQAIELAQAILELSDRDPGGRQTFSYPLRALIDKYRGGPAKAPTADTHKAATKIPQNGAEWQEYEIHKLDLNMALEPCAEHALCRLFLMSRGNQLFCLRPVLTRFSYGGRVDLRLTVHWLPTGELLRQVDVPQGLEVMQVHIDEHMWSWDVLAAALGPDAVYAGTTKGLMVIPWDGRPARVLTEEEGLPGGMVRAIGVLGDRLYLGLGKYPHEIGFSHEKFILEQAVFAEYVPGQKRFRVIASEKSVTRSNVWDGTSFELDQIVGDEKRQCLWIKERKTGLWRFDVQAGALDARPEGGKAPLFEGCHYCGRVGSSSGGYRAAPGDPLVLLNLSTLATNPVPSNRQYPQFLHNSCMVAWDGADRLIVRGDTDILLRPSSKSLFFIQRPDGPPCFLSALPDGSPTPRLIFLQRTDAGVVAVSDCGEGYLIRRKSLLSQYEARDLAAASGDAGETALIRAAADGDLAAVKAQLGAGVAVDAVGGANWTPLHQACAQNQAALAATLIEKGADINRSTAAGKSPLSLATGVGAVDLMRFLLDKGAKADGPPSAGNNAPLFVAVRRKDTAAAELLLKSGANREAREPDEATRTPLLLAAFQDDAAMVGLLLRYKASLQVQDAKGSSPLAIAAMNAGPDTINALLAGGAKVELLDNKGRTPLHLASALGRVDALGALIAGGANPNQPDGKDGSTPLHLATRYKQVAAMRLLAAKGADLNKKANDGWIPLFDAACGDLPAAVSCLIELGADVHRADPNGWTALHTAAKYSRVENVRLLLAAGADPNALYRGEGKPARRPVDFASNPQVAKLLGGVPPPDGKVAVPTPAK